MKVEADLDNVPAQSMHLKVLSLLVMLASLLVLASLNTVLLVTWLMLEA